MTQVDQNRLLTNWSWDLVTEALLPPGGHTPKLLAKTAKENTQGLQL